MPLLKPLNSVQVS